ncbi:MAG: glycogen/starch synthase [Phycisphaerae bacterium]|nr:glycogen/starch synthase [Phycisphaerae bacterium]
MPLLTIYFELHQPFRLHPDATKFLWDEKNDEIFRKVAEKNYIPATRMFTDLIQKHPTFKITFSMSGVFLEQAQKYQPEVIEALQALFDAGYEHEQVEFLQETYYHSLTGLFKDPEKKEFKEQVSLHRDKIKEIFNFKPTSFRNTELMFNNEIADTVEEMGYKSILCELRDDMLISRDGQNISPHAIFRAKPRDGQERSNLLVLARHRHLSDDVAFRFKHTHLTANMYARNLAKVDGEAIVLGYDYEHLGEHIWNDTGIFDFWHNLPAALEQHNNIICANPTEIAERFKDANCPIADIHPLSTSSWADLERNTHGWLGSKTQYTLFQDLENIENDVKHTGGERLEKWRHLTTSDHLYYLHEGSGPDRGVHDYCSPYGSLATATYLLTRNIDQLKNSVKHFIARKRTDVTPVIIISPETYRLPSEGMGQFAKFVSGKSGGLGEVVSALCKGLVTRNITTHFITLNLRRRFCKEAGMTDEAWIHNRHKLDPENIHLVTSSLYEDYQSAYDGDPIVTAAEFQRQIINSYIRDIRNKYDGRAIIHTHDWMAGGAIIPYARMRNIPTLHTVHNTHTANIPIDMLHGVNLSRMWDDLYITMDFGRQCLDAQATAIKNASKVNYVGNTFLHEVMDNFFLDRSIIPDSVRQETRAKYDSGAAFSIANGVSEDIYPENQPENPADEQPGLARAFGPDDNILEAKRLNLVKFQKKTGLNVDPDAILLFWPSRLDPTQKGIELLEQIAQKFVEQHSDVQIAIVGNPVGNDWTHADIMGKIAAGSGGKISYQTYNDDLSLLGYAAASDVFGASLYEPFGLIDVVANLYGATATNRDTGGYHDKIIPLSTKSWGAPQDQGNGVLFKNYDPDGLWWGLDHAVGHFRKFHQDPAEWQKQLKRIMKEARAKHSHENMVAAYITTYE